MPCAISDDAASQMAGKSVLAPAQHSRSPRPWQKSSEDGAPRGYPVQWGRRCCGTFSFGFPLGEEYLAIPLFCRSPISVLLAREPEKGSRSGHSHPLFVAPQFPRSNEWHGPFFFPPQTLHVLLSYSPASKEERGNGRVEGRHRSHNRSCSSAFLTCQPEVLVKPGGFKTLNTYTPRRQHNA